MPYATEISITPITTPTGNNDWDGTYHVRTVTFVKSLYVPHAIDWTPVEPSTEMEHNMRDTMGRVNGDHLRVVNDEEQSEHKLIIGVDFGTTYSGVATVYTGAPEEIDIIKSWPGGNGMTSDKVPTEIAYQSPALNGSVNGRTTPSFASEKVDADGIQRVIRWGFQFKPEESRLRCIKLYLDRNQKLPQFVSPAETAAQLRQCGKTVMDAVTDYLAKLYEHTMETLSRRYGAAFMAETEVQYVLTVPAVWSDAAKNATLQAAERAGMGQRHDIQMISEPEAAALYTLKTVRSNNLRVGSNFVVCDAGGGTVDLVSYRVTSIAPLQVEESEVGTGGLCGSAFLNMRFEDLVRGRIGPARYAELQKKPKSWVIGVRYFEDFVKRNYSEEEHGEINVPFPGLLDDEEAGIDSGFLTISTDEVKGIFDPVVDDVIGLLEGQVGAIRAKGSHVTGIILVGGFGQSNYLYSRLKKHFASMPPPVYTEQPGEDHSSPHSESNIEVMQPLHAWTAVVRGAVLRGVEGSMVKTRKSRHHYGTTYATVFDETKHAQDEKYWSPLWERWMVSDRMQWHIAKGTPVSAEDPISFHYTRNFKDGQEMKVEDDVFACSDDVAPGRLNKGLVTVCTLKTDLNAVPPHLFSRLVTTNGLEFNNLDFELQMRIESANLVFELRVDGIKYGSVEAEFH